MQILEQNQRQIDNQDLASLKENEQGLNPDIAVSENLRGQDLELLHSEPELSKVQATEIDSLSSFEKIKKALPKYGYVFSSLMHMVSGVTSLNKSILGKAFKEGLDKFTVRLSKGITSVYYSLLALDAIKEGKSFDAIARLLDPLFVPWMKLENIHLARGLSAGMSLVDFSQNYKMPKEKQGLISNFVSGMKATASMIKEMIQGGTGEKRKLFVPVEKDKGHTMALFGHTIMLGSALGILSHNQRNTLNKVGGVIRNLGGFLGDMTMVMHGDKSFKLSGLFYAANAVIDALQRFLPDDVIDPINHFNMILNNIGTYFYGQVSNKRNEGSLGKLGGVS